MVATPETDAVPRLAGIDVTLSTRDRRFAELAQEVRRQMGQIGLAIGD